MKRLLTTCVILGVAAGSLATAQATPSQTRRWASPEEATIYPGVQTTTHGVVCSANFVFADARSVYLGQAGACSGVRGDTCGRGVGSQIGAPVKIQGASRPGRVVYHSYNTMHDVRENHGVTCGYNDFALVRIDPADVHRVNPSVPVWGGPAEGDATSSPGDAAYSYGTSKSRGGYDELGSRAGVNAETAHYTIDTVTGWGPGKHEWGNLIHFTTPRMEGDWGSGVLDAKGRALGLITSWSIDGSDGVTDLGMALRYMRDHTKLDAVRLVPGTTSFSPAR